MFGTWLFGCKSQRLELVFAQVQLRQFRLSCLDSATPLKVRWWAALNLPTVRANAPVCGSSAFHTHCDDLMLEVFCGVLVVTCFFIAKAKGRHAHKVCSLPELTQFENGKTAPGG